MTVEPFSEEQPVEEDEVCFLLGADGLEQVEFRRFFLEQHVESRRVRDAETDARLVEEIRAFFCERMGASPGV